MSNDQTQGTSGPQSFLQRQLEALQQRAREIVLQQQMSRQGQKHMVSISRDIDEPMNQQHVSYNIQNPLIHSAINFLAFQQQQQQQQQISSHSHGHDMDLDMTGTGPSQQMSTVPSVSSTGNSSNTNLLESLLDAQPMANSRHTSDNLLAMYLQHQQQHQKNRERSESGGSD
jgi:hypothetical protein